MSEETAPPTADEAPEMLDEARRLIDLARQRDIVLRLLGGLAIRLLTPELPPRTRVGQDLDFGSVKSSRKPLTELLAAEGYVADRNFNALYGDKQLYFTHGEHGHAVDVMIDRLHMCHTVAFAERSTLMPYTLSPVDLLLSKLQIVELNEKDLDDCLRLLVSFDVADSDDPGTIDLRVIAALVGEDWGWWKTIGLNLERIEGILADGVPATVQGGRLDPRPAVATLSRTLTDTTKSRRWKMRDRIGERKRWYEVPEETPHH
ncbi:MAG TPA: hypothetical protein VG325_09120 [Solirubrobacteraceae bacterium]|nr:hypothetical protein [Solirubrobacteraceae bacterium]